MAWTPGQTSGAMLTLLPESQLAFAQRSRPAALPLASRGASASNELTAEPPRLRLRRGCCPVSCCRSINVCFANELALDTSWGGCLPYPARRPLLSSPSLAKEKGSRSRERLTRSAKLVAERPSWDCLSGRDGGENGRLLCAARCAGWGLSTPRPCNFETQDFFFSFCGWENWSLMRVTDLTPQSKRCQN